MARHVRTRDEQHGAGAIRRSKTSLGREQAPRLQQFRQPLLAAQAAGERHDQPAIGDPEVRAQPRTVGAPRSEVLRVDWIGEEVNACIVHAGIARLLLDFPRDAGERVRSGVDAGDQRLRPAARQGARLNANAAQRRMCAGCASRKGTGWRAAKSLTMKPRTVGAG